MNEVILKTSKFRPPQGDPVIVTIVRQGAYVGPQFLCVNGEKNVGPVGEITRVDVSPSGQRFAVTVKNEDGTHHVVVDREANPALLEPISRVAFSEDSGHYSYTAKMKDSRGEVKYVVVVDGRVTHEEPYVSGYDAHANSPGPAYRSNLEPSA